MLALLYDLGYQTGYQGDLEAVQRRSDDFFQRVRFTRLARVEYVSAAVRQAAHRHDGWHDALQVAGFDIGVELGDEVGVLQALEV